MEGQFNSNAGTYTFLFDADNDAFDGYYGTPCGEMLFGAVLSRQQPICARVFSGDMALAQPGHFLLRACGLQRVLFGVDHLQMPEPRLPSSLRITRARGHTAVLEISATSNRLGSSLLPVPMQLMMGVPASVALWISSLLETVSIASMI